MNSKLTTIQDRLDYDLSNLNIKDSNNLDFKDMSINNKNISKNDVQLVKQKYLIEKETLLS